MSQIAKGKLNIEPLTGSNNYLTWNSKITIYLQIQGQIDEKTYDQYLANEPNPNSQEEIKEDALTKVTLINHISTEVFLSLPSSSRTSSKKMWDHLKAQFASNLIITTSDLRAKLYNLKLKNQGVKAYLNEIKSIQEQLAQNAVQLSEHELRSAILHGLPESYAAFKTSVNLKKTPPSIIRIEETLISEEARMDKTPKSSSLLSHEKLYCRNCKMKNHSTKNCKRYCKHCKNKSHWSKNCRKTKYQANINSVEMLISKTIDNEFYLDSGCTNTIVNNINLLHDAKKSNYKIKIGDGKFIPTQKQGYILIPQTNFKIKALYSNHATHNLISSADLSENGFDVHFPKNVNHAIITTPNNDKIKLIQHGRLYKFPTSEINLHEKDIDLYHNRLGHLSHKNVSRLLDKNNNFVEGNITPSQRITCDDCKISNIKHKTIHGKDYINATRLLECVHSDVAGPLPESQGGAKYNVIFIDAYSRFKTTYQIKKKSQVFETFVKYKTLVENFTKQKIARLHSDNGGEYISNEFKEYCISNGINQTFTPPYRPELNGVAERANQTLFTKVRSMLNKAKLPVTFWAEAMQTATHLTNISPTSKLNITPYEIWNKRKPNISYLRTFGCKAIFKIAKNTKKLDKKGLIGIFLGYMDTRGTYKIWYNNDVIITRDVAFDENKFPYNELIRYNIISQPTNNELNYDYNNLNVNNINNNDNNQQINQPYEEAIQNNEPINHPIEPEFQPQQVINDTHQPTTQTVEQSTEQSSTQTVHRQFEDISAGRTTLPKRVSKPVNRTNLLHIIEPTSYNEAINCNEREQWLQAMHEELQSLNKNNTWTLVDKPKDRRIINCKWVFKIKKDTKGDIMKFKARLVAVGSSQTHGIDYVETFSPVIKWETVKILLTICETPLIHIDISSAYLHGNLEEEIYMQQPPGFKTDNQVCLLNKSLYGLKQSGRVWNDTLSNSLKKFNMVQSDYDPCLYTSKTTILLVYVDDILIGGNSNNLIKHLDNNFKIKNLGIVNQFLNVKFTYHNDKIILNQTNYINELLIKYNMIGCNPTNTPLIKSNDDGAKLTIEKISLYQQIIGNLIYLANSTRPDLLFCTSYLSRFMTNPKTIHLTSAKRVLRYLKGTINFSLSLNKPNCSKNYGKSSSPGNAINILGISDSDYANDYSSKSTSGYLLLLNNNPVVIKSQLQKIVTLSSTEAELTALTDLLKTIIWVKNLLNELNVFSETILVQTDSNSAIKLLKHPKINARTKHIRTRIAFIKQTLSLFNIELQHISTNENMADILTKPVSAAKLSVMIKNYFEEIKITRE